MHQFSGKDLRGLARPRRTLSAWLISKSIPDRRHELNRSSYLSLRSRLNLLVLGAILPLAVLAATVIYFFFEANRTAASDQLLRLSRSLISNVEAHVQAITSAAQVLSVSHDLRDGNLRGFLDDASTFLRAFNPDSSIVLTDKFGTQILNTAAEDPLARRVLNVDATRQAREVVFRTGRPAISAHFYAPILKAHMVTINVPVMKDGAPLYNLGIPITVDTLSGILNQQNLQPDWTVAIWDSGGTVIARNRDISNFAGRRASPTIYPAIVEKRDRILTTVTFDGVRVLTALVYSPSLDWSLAVGVPQEAIMRPLWNALSVIVGFSLACLLISGLAASRLARRVINTDRHRELLLDELNHRVNNSLATVQGIARQTLRRARTKEEAMTSLEGRIMALSRAHKVLNSEHWDSATMREIVGRAVEPFMSAQGSLEMDGPDVRLHPRAALAMSLAIHELATNAVRHGALSVAAGRVRFTWQVDGDLLSARWAESGGPAVSNPAHKGFGTTLFERGLSQDLQGSANLDYRPDGLVATLTCRLA